MILSDQYELHTDKARDRLPSIELEDMQRLVVYGFQERPFTTYFLLQIGGPEAEPARRARAWLAAAVTPPKAAAHRVLDARRERRDEPAVSVAVAFTFEGLRALGLDESALETFVPEFRQGMTDGHRARMLGDVDGNSSEHWHWGQWGKKEHPDKEVHMFVGAYAKTRGDLDAWRPAWEENGLKLMSSVRAQLERNEPFGFRDGISQPYIKGSGRTLTDIPERDQIAAGEFVLGYPNAFARFSESPRVRAELDPLRPPDQKPILPATVDDKYHDLGRNGTFLVVRELKQDIDRFKKLSEHNAVRTVGRWMDGTPLVLRPVPQDSPGKTGEEAARDRAGAAPTSSGADSSSQKASPTAEPIDPSSLNAFAYFDEDAAGLRCPLGAHVRRSNPRDALANPEKGTSAATAQALVNNHRIIRRSRVFHRTEPEKSTGIFFQCINTNLERQFEFVQQTWINNPKFGGPYDERDPVIGSGPHHERGFTVAAAPERKRFDGLEAYVTVCGGAYFFLPGLRAIKYLSQLEPTPHSAHVPDGGEPER
jgi:deferrochelatase/peroxidase EfeB